MASVLLLIKKGEYLNLINLQLRLHLLPHPPNLQKDNNTLIKNYQFVDREWYINDS